MHIATNVIREGECLVLIGLEYFHLALLDRFEGEYPELIMYGVFELVG